MANSMKVAELRDKLREYGLPVSGNKPDLLKRLNAEVHRRNEKSREEWNATHAERFANFDQDNAELKELLWPAKDTEELKERVGLPVDAPECDDNAANVELEPRDAPLDPSSENKTGEDYCEFKRRVNKDIATLKTVLHNLCGTGNLIFGAANTVDLLREIDTLRQRVKEQEELITLLTENYRSEAESPTDNRRCEATPIPGAVATPNGWSSPPPRARDAPPAALSTAPSHVTSGFPPTPTNRPLPANAPTTETPTLSSGPRPRDRPPPNSAPPSATPTSSFNARPPPIPHPVPPTCAPPSATPAPSLSNRPPPLPHPRRPLIVVNPYPERQTGMRSVPGDKKYSEAHQRKVLLLTDSICGGVKRAEMMDEMKQHGMDIDLTIRRFTGGQSHEIFHHAKQSLVDEQPDGLIVVCGTNDLPRRDGRRQLNNDEIASNILATGELAREHGVRKIFISGITYRKGVYYESRIRGINKILEVECIKRGFIFINNRDIESYHTDGLHLNKEGTSLLKRNIINSMC